MPGAVSIGRTLMRCAVNLARLLRRIRRVVCEALFRRAFRAPAAAACAVLRRRIARYIHVDFSLGGGFAHVIDNVPEFPRDFAQHVIAGMRLVCTLLYMYCTLRDFPTAANSRTCTCFQPQSKLRCEMTILDRAYTCKEECPRRFTT